MEPWASSAAALLEHPLASFDYSVMGDSTWTVVNREGEHGREWESDATAAYFNALAWAVTADARHAEKCVEIFDAWSGLTEVTGGGTEALNAGLFAWKMVEAAELVRNTYDAWSPEDIRAFADMLVYPGYSNTAVPESLSENNGTFYWRIYRGDPGRHGNQDIIAWRAMITLGVFLDNATLFERALNYVEGLAHPTGDLPYASGPSPSGAELDDNPYFTTYQYVGSEGSVEDYGYNGVLEHYIWDNGQIQESSRDQQHTLFGLSAMAGIAEVAWNQGDELYNALDSRILRGFEFAGRYNTSFVIPFPDQPEPWEPTVTERLDRTGRWLSKAVNPHFENDFEQLSRGDFAGKRPVFEQPLAHYEVRMGLPAELTTWTRRSRDVAIELSGFESGGFSLDHAGWGALTFRRPELCAGDPISGFDERGVPSYEIPVVPTTIEAEHYDDFPGDGEGHTFSDETPVNTAHQYREDGVDVACIADETYGVTDTVAGEWLSYTVFVPETRDYRVAVRYGASTRGGEIRVAFGPSTSTPSVPLAPSAELDEAELSDGLRLAAGVTAMRVFIVAGGFDLDSIIVE